MGRTSCCSKGGLHKGPWTAREDALLVNFIQEHGEGHWRALPKKAGLLRCGKSCRLRWMNYLRPDIKRGNITTDEDDLIIKLHSLLGNRWSLIAGRLPGRTDNEIKNYWNSHLSKRLAVTSDQNTEAQKVEIALNSENGETSKTRSPTRASPFSGQRDDDNSNSGMASGLPLSPARPEEGSDGGGAEAEADAELAAPSWCNMSGEEIQNSRGGVEVEESGHLFYGFEVFCEGSWSSPVNGDMIDEVEDDSYQQLLNLEGEDYIQLESFIDYFLI